MNGSWTYNFAERTETNEQAILGEDTKPPLPSDALPVEQVDLISRNVVHVARFGLLENDLVVRELQLPGHLKIKNQFKFSSDLDFKKIENKCQMDSQADSIVKLREQKMFPHHSSGNFLGNIVELQRLHGSGIPSVGHQKLNQRRGKKSTEMISKSFAQFPTFSAKVDQKLS